jgi:hypothetical protein
MQHLPDVVRTRLDSWYPAHLPARFRPRARPRAPRLLRPLPLALAALLLVLLAAGAAAGPTRVLTDAIVNLAGSHPATTPSPHARGEVRSAPGQSRQATTTVTAVPANPAALAGPTLIRTHRTASGSRTMPPLPISSSDPLLAGSPPPSSSPLPETNPNGSPGDQPSPPPSPSPSLGPGVAPG